MAKPTYLDPDGLRCPVCDKRMPNQGALSAHMNRHRREDREAHLKAEAEKEKPT